MSKTQKQTPNRKSAAANKPADKNPKTNLSKLFPPDTKCQKLTNDKPAFQIKMQTSIIRQCLSTFNIPTQQELLDGIRKAINGDYFKLSSGDAELNLLADCKRYLKPFLLHILQFFDGINKEQQLDILDNLTKRYDKFNVQANALSEQYERLLNFVYTGLSNREKAILLLNEFCVLIGINQAHLGFEKFENILSDYITANKNDIVEKVSKEAAQSRDEYLMELSEILNSADKYLNIVETLQD